MSVKTALDFCSTPTCASSRGSTRSGTPAAPPPGSPLRLGTADLHALSSKVSVVTGIEPPYQMQETGRSLTGVSVELEQMMLKEAGIDPVIQVLPWARAYRMAQQVENVMLFSILRDPPREKLFKWLGALHPFEEMLFLGRIDLLPSDPIILSYWFKVMNDNPTSTQHYDIEKVERVHHIAGADGENYIAMSPQTDDRVVEHFRRALDRVKASPRYRQLLDKYLK